MPLAVEAAAPVVGYSLRHAGEDLVGGALRPRRPVRRHAVPLGWGAQAALVATAGLVQGLDVYLREPFRPSDVPAALVGWLPVLDLVGNPAIAVLVTLALWLLMLGGGWLVALGRLAPRPLGSGLAFGWWSATLPVLGAVALGIAAGLRTDTVALAVVFLVALHLVPSVAEAGGLSVGRAFGVIVLGPLAAISLVVLGLLLLGFAAKLLGVRLP